MKAKIDLGKFEKMYELFDGAHGQEHIERVRELAAKLADKYLPAKRDLVYVAATLHDIGLVQGRDNHEESGARMVEADEDLKKMLSREEIGEIAEAIREHRASNGNPSSVLAKIVSDADKASDTTSQAVKRAMDFGKTHYPDLTRQEMIERVGKHLKDKFGPGGPGRRAYFPETEQTMKDTFDPIIEAYDRKDWGQLAKWADA